MNFDAILFGAFERHNFGDLLMGYVFKELLEKKGIKTIHASILSNDLTSCSGTRVYSIFRLLDAGLDVNTPILHVGGETAACSFNDALGCDSPFPLPYHLKDTVCTELQQLLGTDRPLPYLTPPHEVIHGVASSWPNRLFYGVGFTSPKISDVNRKRLREAFIESRMSGFRDGFSMANASSIGIEDVTFTPDIVLYISKLMPFPSEAKSNYLLIHFNQEYLRKNGRSLLKELSQVAHLFEDGIKIGLAGTAQSHDSLEALYNFKELANNSSMSIEVLPSVDIFSICKQIANATAVASTSLHYRIIARSYGVPRLSMHGHKVNCWSKSNDNLYPYGVESEQLAAAIESVINPSSRLVEIGQERDIAIIDESIEKIARIIHSVKTLPNGRILESQTPPPQAPSPDLWVAAMAHCMDQKASIAEKSAKMLERNEACLSSRRFLIKRLLRLLLPSLAR